MIDEPVSEASRWRELLGAVVSIGAGLDLRGTLERVIQAAVDVSGATYGALGVLNDGGDRLVDFITVGVSDGERAAIGDLPEGKGLLGEIIVSPQPLRVDAIDQHPHRYGFPANHPPMHTMLGVPIRVRNTVFGNLYLTDKRGGESFTEVDEEIVIGLATAAAVAIENSRLHERVGDLALLDDRERIGRDLHDTVIQRLFAIGLSLQGTVPLVTSEPDEAIRRIDDGIDSLDTTVKHIRSVIFGLQARRDAGSLGDRISALCDESSRALGFVPDAVIRGPVDRVPVEVQTELLATLREALSNVARHADASRIEVRVSVDDAVHLVVLDDGTGPPSSNSGTGRGLENMADRAARLGGRFEFRAAAPAGAVVEWTVPMA